MSNGADDKQAGHAYTTDGKGGWIEATVQKEYRFNVDVGGVTFRDLRIVGELAGMTELRNENGDSIVLDASLRGPKVPGFSELFGITSMKPSESDKVSGVTVLKASGSILAAIEKPKASS